MISTDSIIVFYSGLQDLETEVIAVKQLSCLPSTVSDSSALCKRRVLNWLTCRSSCTLISSRNLCISYANNTKSASVPTACWAPEEESRHTANMAARSSFDSVIFVDIVGNDLVIICRVPDMPAVLEDELVLKVAYNHA